MKRIFVLILMALGLVLSSSGLAYATDLSTNLVTNGDGNNLASWTKVIDSTYEDHWTVETHGGDAGYAPVSPYDTAGGGNEFYDYWEISGPASKNGQIYQDIPLTDTAGLFSKIDAGNIGLNAEAYIYKYLTADTGRLEIQFLDGSNNQISVGPYQSSVSTGGSWEKVEKKHIAVPANTRKIRVILTALLTTNNSYVDFDGIDVRLCNLPNISITNPTANHSYQGSDTITISGTASDPDTLALTISAVINGHTATTSIPSGAGGAWSLSWDIAGLPINPGDYSNIIITADNGLETNTKTYTGTLTVTAPHKTAAASAASAGPAVGADNTVTITVKDSAGIADRDFDGNKTVTITGYEAAPDTTYGSFGGTDLEADGSTDVTVNFTDGVGTASLKLNKAAAQTIGFSVAGVDTPATNNLSITPTAGAVVSLTVTQQPAPGAASGDAFATQPVVTLKDQYNNTCSTGPSATANVTATAKAGTGTWTIGGTTTQAAVAGVATFTDLTCTLATPGDGAITFTSGATVDSSAFTIPNKTAKALTADTTSNDVDHDIEITFVEDATFRAAITGVTFNGNTLTTNQYTTTTAGKIILHPNNADNNYLRTPATANVVVTATGYNNSTISQTITAGAVASLVVTQQPAPGAASGDAFATQPVVTLKDQYNNTCSTGPSATANVTATTKAGTGTWTIGGATTKAAVAGVATFTDLTCTLVTPGDGAITFTSGATVDSSAFTIPNKTAKALTADTTSNDVDHDIEITFVEDATFRAAITGVTFNGNTLTPNQYTTTTAGKIILHPNNADNNYLRTPATANVVVTATGYNNSTISQTITAGAVASLVVTQQPAPGAASGDAFATQPVVTLKDQYNNTCANGPSATANVVATAKAGTGTWTIGGTTTQAAVAGVATFTDLTCTLVTPGDGAITFTSGAFTVDSNIFALPTPPTLASAARTDNTHITVTLSKNCVNITKANDGGFTVQETGAPGTTYAVSAIAQGVDASHVVLTVADMGISAKEGVTVKYTAGGNGTVQDIAGNDMVTDGTGVTVSAWDTTSPTLTGGTLAASNAYIDVTFDEGVYGSTEGATALSAAKLALTFTQNGGTATNAVISSVKQNDNAAEGSASALAGDETTVRVFLTITGTPNGLETIEIKPANAASIYDKAGNSVSELQTTGAKTLNDQSPPRVNTYSPADNAANVSETANLVLTFSKNVTAVAGKNIVIKKSSDNSTVETISATGGQVTGSGSATITIDPSVILESGAAYYVQIEAGAFKDAGNHPYAGIVDTTTWNFTVTTHTGGGDSGGTSTPAGDTVLTADQIAQSLNNNQPLDLDFTGLNLTMDPEALPDLGGGTLRIESSVVTDPNALNTFFIAYPGQRGIMKGYNITFTLEGNGRSENLTQLNGEITLTFEFSPQELEGLDPGTLIIYKQGDDGGIAELKGQFNWQTNSLSVSASHLCKFFIMGQEGIPAQRLAGDNRYATAAVISAQGWQASDNVILVSGENFPDALAGTALAGCKEAPILLTAKDRLPGETLTEIRRLKPKTIYILGGEGVIAKAVADSLTQDYTVIRVAGGNRYETATRIGQIIALGDADPNPSTSAQTDTVIIATGLNFPDALAAAPFAGKYQLPVLFTEKDGLNEYTRQALSKWGVKNVILAGGSGVVSDQVQNILRNELNLTVTRLSGEDRYATALEIVKYFAGYQGSGTYQKAALATGENFPDVLAGASLAAKEGFPVLLARKDRVDSGSRAYLQSQNLKKIYVYGGKEVLTDKVKGEVSLK